MSSTIKIPAMPEPEVIDRHLPTGITLRGFTKKQLAARDAQWQESMKALVLHLQDAISACNSVSTCLDRKVIRDGCVMYLQTEEWCKWLEEELQPQFRAALSAITEE